MGLRGRGNGGDGSRLAGSPETRFAVPLSLTLNFASRMSRRVAASAIKTGLSQAAQAESFSEVQQGPNDMLQGRSDAVCFPSTGWRWWLGGVWAGPNSLLGLIAAIPVRVGGGQWQRLEGTLECSGPLVEWFFARCVRRPGIAAITLGDVILGVSPEVLARVRRHERVHVRQYRRWGPLFLPAYAAASLVLWLRGKDAYRDNPFEVAAYNEETP